MDSGALGEALRRVVDRHEGLRVTFVSGEDGRPVQRIAATAADAGFALVEEDASALDEAALRERVDALLARPFDLSRGPLFRAHLLVCGPERFVLVIGGHHAVLDGWSVGLLLGEVAALYREAVTGEPAVLPDLSIQYGDYAAWQREILSGDRLAAETDWWRETLAGIPEAISLPFDRPRPKVMDYQGGSVAVDIPADVTAKLNDLARSQGASLFMVLDAAFAALLSRLGAGEDVVIGTAVAGRSRSELEALAGFFINTIALRHRIDGSLSFLDHLAATKEGVLDAFAHQAVPFETIVEAVSPVRSLGHPPVVQVLLVLQNTPDADRALTLPGMRVKSHSSGGEAAKFDLSLNLTERDEALVGRLSYSRQLFDQETVERLVAMFIRLLGQAATSPETPITDLPLLDEGERRHVVEVFNDTAVDYPRDKTVIDLFAEQAAARPDAVAVVDGDRTLTYSALDAASNRLARHLISKGVG
ncbi:MAG: condensation domain-containing protein, partial [Pseudomonadota bacterium]